MRKLCREIKPELNDREILLYGWVHDLRDFGGLRFVVVKDRTGKSQVTLHKASVEEAVFNVFDDLTKESCVKIIGKVQSNEKAPNGVEVIPTEFEVLSKADAPTPIDTSGKIVSDLSVRLDYRFLDLRDPKKLALFKLRSKIVKHTTDFFDLKDFAMIQTPKITSAGVESGAELFELKYFDKPAYLSQSPQIYKQMMVCAGFEKVFEIGPVFRAENSHTTRHLTEFTGVDFEMGFIESENEVMDIIEEYFTYLLSKLKDECSEELAMFDVNPIIPREIPRITMIDAKKMLAEKGKILPEKEDLDAEAERMLGEIVLEKYNEEFVFVTEYPVEKRPFYHMRPENNPGITKSFDLIWNGVEIATGAQREHRYGVLKKQAKENGIDLDSMKDYANIFKYGAPPHGGVGFGLDRIVQRLMKLDNIKEALLIARDPDRLTP